MVSAVEQPVMERGRGRGLGNSLLALESSQRDDGPKLLLTALLQQLDFDVPILETYCRLVQASLHDVTHSAGQGTLKREKKNLVYGVVPRQNAIIDSIAQDSDIHSMNDVPCDPHELGASRLSGDDTLFDHSLHGRTCGG